MSLQPSSIRPRRRQPSRRGTILVLVVGVLALMAIIIVMFTTIGQSDRRGAAALVRQSAQEERGRDVADYLATVVGNGTFKVEYQQQAGAETVGGSQRLKVTPHRVAADYPGVDPFMKSIQGTRAVDPALVFNPTGSQDVAWPLVSVDPRRVVSPYLASSDPTRLDDGRAYPELNQPWRDFRDWRAITNVAPDGRFVNLGAIRNNFNAESGIGRDATGKARTTFGLTLLTDETAMPNATTALTDGWPRATLRMARPVITLDPQGVPLAVTRRDVLGQTMDGDNYFPFDFTMNQVGLFRQSQENRGSRARVTGLNRGYAQTPGDRIVPGDWEFLGNQYADADGDGFLDSRWFELVDASGLSLDVRNAPRKLLADSGNLRYFVATRIVDLSSKVNVNTATTFRVGPDEYSPAGLTPADVDLERILRGRDQYFAGLLTYNVPGGTPNRQGYERLSQPRNYYRAGQTVDVDAGNYNNAVGYGPIAVPGTGRTYGEWAGYSAFASLLDSRVQSSTAPASGAANSPNPLLPDINGNFPGAYVRPTQVKASNTAQGTPGVYFFPEMDNLGNVLDVPETAVGPGVFRPEDRALLYQLAGRDNTGIALRSKVLGTGSQANSESLQFRGSGRFDLADELELRTYERVNDPASTSRLEQVTTGRFDAAMIGGPRFVGKNFGPLRSNRGFELERLDRDRYNANRPEATQIIEPDGSQDDDAYLQAMVDIRQRLTTISGDRPIISGSLPNAAAVNSLGDELRLDINGVIELANQAANATNGNNYAPNYSLGQSAVEQLFRVAADALLPFSSELDAGGNAAASGHWNGGPAHPARTLAYGGSRLAYTPANGNATPLGINAPENFGGASNELALRLAAHWAVNLIDSRQTFPMESAPNYDPVSNGRPAADRPSEFTVVLGSQIRQFGGSSTVDRLDQGVRFVGAAPDFPSWAAPGTPTLPPIYANQGPYQPRLAGGLDLDRSQRSVPPASAVWRLPQPGVTPARLQDDAITVYGIRPQPFITQAASLVMYAAKVGAQKLVIDGSVSESNRSYIGEIVVFHIHNPFDTELSLSALRVDSQGRVLNVREGDEIDGTQLRHYIEFAGKYYALAKTDRFENSFQNVTLEPGETRAFWVSDQLPGDIVGRINDNNPAGNVTIDQFLSWLERQLVVDNTFPAAAPANGDRKQPVRMPRIDVDSLNLTAATQGPTGVLALANPAEINSSRVVRLWRVTRTTAEAGQNVQRNDVLVDRMRDPQNAGGGVVTANNVSLNRRMSNSERSIDIGQGNTPAPGRCIVRWGKFRRPSDPGINGQVPNGVLPAYCMEAKFPLPPVAGVDQIARAAGVVRSLNEEAEDPYSNNFDGNGDLNLGDFAYDTNTKPGAHSSFSMLFMAHQTRATPLVVDLNDEPRSYTGNNPGRNLSGVLFIDPPTASPTSTRYIRLPMLLPMHRGVPNFTGEGRVGLRGSLRDQSNNPGLNNRLLAAPPLRPADVLDIPAIGASHRPAALRATGLAFEDPLNLDAQWTTLAEAAALAADYDSPANDAGNGIFPVEYRLGAERAKDASASIQRPALAARVDGALLHGRLIANEGVPFVDVNSDGLFESSLAGRDIRRGNGTTFAMDLVNRIRTSPAGSRTSMVTGRININTAPLAVLRALPMLTPDDVGFMGSATGGPFNLNIDNWDIAATLAAYRDKTVVPTRYTTGIPAVLRLPNFRDDNSFDPTVTAAITGGGVPFPTLLSQPAVLGREYATGIAGIREEAGFSSAGEILGIKTLPGTYRYNGGVLNLTASQAGDISIDRLAGQNAGQFSDRSDPKANYLGWSNGRRIFGVTNDYVHNAAYVAPTAGQQPLPFVAGTLPDQAPMRDALANAVLNSITVRSDVFCVWFVVQGYQASDAEGLGPDDPMVPTVRRRYVMVVDRSSVVSKGEKPRILLFEEVPINN